MKRPVLFMVLICLFIFSCMGARAYAGEIDLLLDKLVDKGILTQDEAAQIKTETEQEMKREPAAAPAESLPQWIQTVKLKGDFRLRYQYDHAKELAGSSTNKSGDQHRARIRMRLGLESKVNDKVLVGVGIATGKDDGSSDAARSTNVTLGEGGFGKKPIALNYAFAKYMPAAWVNLIGGKFHNPLWEPGDLIWDTDINPEGGVINLSKKLNSAMELFLNTGVLTVESNKTWSADATAYVAQPGLKLKLNDSATLKGAVSYYGFSGVRGKTLSGSTGTNSNTGGALTYNYRNVTPAVELSIKDPLKRLGIDLPYLALFGEYVKNLVSEVPDDDTGYMVGLKFGAEKVDKFGDWQFRYNYAMLGKDAILDILPDSDRYGGKTGIRSHEAMFDFGLAKNTWLGLDYYYSWQLPGNFGQTQTKPASVVQVDWNMKF